MSAFTKFPSFDEVVQGAIAAFRRFPAAMVCAINGTVLSLYLIEQSRMETEFAVNSLIMTLALGLPLFIAITTLVEKRRLSLAVSLALHAVVLVLMVIHYFSLPTNESLYYAPMLRLVVLVIGAHALVAWLAWTGQGQLVGFWEYNKALFLRFATAALYSGVLYAGLALALLTADQLFELDVPWQRYAQLWYLIAGIFNTWYFLGGVPRDLDALNNGEPFPRYLKIFAQFVLLPLVIVYFGILITYEAKILFTWDWPKGWVSVPVLCFSGTGILTLLFLYPLRDREGSRWIRGFINWFFAGVLPLLVLLWLAIGMRISDYGVTENRYFVVALGAGLTVTALYFVISRAKDIRIVPIVITALALIAAVGPWNAFSVSRSSQVDRLDQMLAEAQLWIDGDKLEVDTDISPDQQRQMSQLVHYLSEWHGAEAFDRWLPDGQRAEVIDKYGRVSRNEVATALGFEYTGVYDTKYLYFRANVPRALWLADYDMLIRFHRATMVRNDSLERFQGEEYSCWVGFTGDTRDLRLHFGDAIEQDTCRVHLAEAVLLFDEEADEGNVVPLDVATFKVEAGNYEATVYVEAVSAMRQGELPSLQSADVWILTSKKTGAE